MRMCLCLLLVAGVFPCPAQDINAPTKTLGLSNGRLWRALGRGDGKDLGI